MTRFGSCGLPDGRNCFFSPADYAIIAAKEKASKHRFLCGISGQASEEIGQEALKVYMDMDFDGLRADIVQMLGGGAVSVNTRSFQNDMKTFKTKDDVLTLLIHLGYLAYDSKEKKTFIPNREVMGEFETAMSVSGWTEVMRILKASEE